MASRRRPSTPTSPDGGCWPSASMRGDGRGCGQTPAGGRRAAGPPPPVPDRSMAAQREPEEFRRPDHSAARSLFRYPTVTWRRPRGARCADRFARHGNTRLKSARLRQPPDRLHQLRFGRSRRRRPRPGRRPAFSPCHGATHQLTSRVYAPFYVRRIGSDGFQVRYQPTLKKVVSDRRASLDEPTEIRPTIRNLVQKEFERGASIPSCHSRRTARPSRTRLA
jgi:hypothetical protein